MIFFQRQKRQLFADFGLEIHNHEFQADFNRKKVSRIYKELLNFNEKILITLLHSIKNYEINNFFMNNYQNKIGIFVKLM